MPLLLRFRSTPSARTLLVVDPFFLPLFFALFCPWLLRSPSLLAAVAALFRFLPPAMVEKEWYEASASAFQKIAGIRALYLMVNFGQKITSALYGEEDYEV